jgi:hypothetical protein
MKPVKTHTFNGRKHRIHVGPVDGICFNSERNERDHDLFILTSLGEKDGLITAVHEAMHALNWKAKEEQIDQDSKELGTFLWRLGFRWTPEQL